MLILEIYLGTLVAWVFYVAAMGIKAKLPLMHPVVRWSLGYPAYALAYILDVLINVLATFVFVSKRFPFIDLPHGRNWWVLTGRLQRLKIGPDGWAKNAATWVCAEVLNPFNPGHC